MKVSRHGLPVSVDILFIWKKLMYFLLFIYLHLYGYTTKHFHCKIISVAIYFLNKYFGISFCAFLGKWQIIIRRAPHLDCVLLWIPDYSRWWSPSGVGFRSPGLGFASCAAEALDNFRGRERDLEEKTHIYMYKLDCNICNLKIEQQTRTNNV